MEFYAHTLQTRDGTTADCSLWQPLSDHLNNTANLAEGYAIEGLKHCARLMGLLHDIGKYQPSFQKRLNGSAVHVDHAVCGGKEIMSAFGRQKTLACIFAYGITGHHSGLPDKGNIGENSDPTSLLARLKKPCEDYSYYRKEITADTFQAEQELRAFFTANNDKDAYEFLIRYLYSCLTDADFIDTERFCLGTVRGNYNAEWADCLLKLNNRYNSFKAETPLQQARTALKNQALGNITEHSSVYLLDMPTGSGKTLCSVALALERVRLSGKKRIIYVIPYTSIIEQTAETLQKLFPSLTILQHHCNFDFDKNTDAEEGEDDGEISATEKLKKSTENWDVPMVITTNVQFFESIYSNRSSKLRKLHNMADSVIIFDEIHTLPIEWFIPCIKAVEQLTLHYNSEALFLTATMPDFSALCERFIGHPLQVKDLLPDKSLYSTFDKCTFEYVGEADVLERLTPEVSTLVICNKKKTAEDMYNKYNGHKYHLSTYMTPLDRSMVIGRIREDLSNGIKPVVFSTSLVEAGVDFDFDSVWREVAGVDNILQAAGRCNREGLRSKENSKVYIFSTGEKSIDEMAKKINTTQGLLNKYGAAGISSPQCVREYFMRLYEAEKDNMETTSDDYDINFKKIADDFKYIDSITIGIVIPYKDTEKEKGNSAEIAALRAGFPNHRKLQKYSANINEKELSSLLSAGVVTNYNGVYLLEDTSLYSPKTGINTKPQTGVGIEF